MQKKNILLHAAHSISILKTALPCLGIALVFACNQAVKQETPERTTGYEKADSVKPKYTADMVDNLKDPSCGMPLTAGLSDTLHYNGKVYGFCSDECRDEFKKNPEALAKSAVMKK